MGWAGGLGLGRGRLAANRERVLTRSEAVVIAESGREGKVGRVSDGHA